jgi:hypothetical protein
VFTLILICGAVLLSVATRITPHVRQQAVTALNELFKGDVANGEGNASKLVIDQIVSRTARLDIVPRDVKGRRVSLDVAIDDGRVEDVLKLRSRPRSWS